MYSIHDPDHKFTVGERVILTEPNRRRDGREYEEGTVSKVGRTLVHVKVPGVILKFYMDTRRMQTDFVGRTLFTPEEYTTYRRRAEVLKALREEHKLRWEYGGYEPPLEVLEEILAVLERYREGEA